MPYIITKNNSTEVYSNDLKAFTSRKEAGVECWFSMYEQAESVIEGLINKYNIEEELKIEIIKVV